MTNQIPQTSRTELAEFLLRRLLSYPEVANTGVSVKVVYSALKGNNITRKELKMARKNIGVVSAKIDGVQFWRLPQAEE